MFPDVGDPGLQAPEDPPVNPIEGGEFIAHAPPDVVGPLDMVVNPPVLEFNDWPDPGSEHDSEIEDPPGEAPVGEDQDPAYNEAEAMARAEYDPLNEPEVRDAQLRQEFDEQFGELAEEQWVELFDEHLRRSDVPMLKLLATRIRTHFSRQTWDELRFGAFEPAGVPSEFMAYRRLRNLSGFNFRAYDCCVNSCICFLGKYAEHNQCDYCREPRHNAAGHTRRSFHYTPLIPQLQALFRDRNMIEKLGYRARAEAVYDPDVTYDVFDSENYRTLRNTQVHPESDYCFFDNPEDLALGIATDGFTLFKRRERGLSTAWPIIVLNYNIDPRYRTRLENTLCVGVIPGPRQCKDLNSFLVPLLDELLLLERGVESIKVPLEVNPEYPDAGISFVLRAFMIMLMGDIPAVTKLLAMKGHNGKTPCRTCYIQGVPYRYPRTTVYYVPLTMPGGEQALQPNLLLHRTHELFQLHYRSLEALNDNPPRRTELSQDLGINARPIFARLKSIDLATCAPYDIMHLLFENLVPNMIAHWTGRFKNLDQGIGNYELAPGAWDEIGRLTAAAAPLIPSRFVGTLPDIASHQSLYKAEAYAFWWQYIGPILLHGRLNQPYYDHYILGREIVIRSVQLTITSEQIDELEEMIFRWVSEYEQLYYQHDYNRLRTCPLTIHALLHIPYYIRHTGPLCASWAFFVERFCGRLLPAVKNRYQPYQHLDNYILRRAQLKAACHKYGLPQLARSTVKWRYEGDERLSERECRYEAFPDIILGPPFKQSVEVSRQLLNLFTRYFGPVYNRLRYTPADLRARVDTHSVRSFGRFRMTDDGDRIRTASAVTRANRPEASARDNSFIRLVLLPDENADEESMSDVPIEEVYYGQLIDIYYVEFIEDLENDIRAPYLLVRVKLCKDTNGLDAALPETPRVEYRVLDSDELFHIETVNAVVGRVPINHNTYGIIDRSRDGARTQFRDDDDFDRDE
ncbi:Transposase family Tnp2 protein [Ceratobasidium sp. AG-Ba]|nr:Transposase family Tnp2 protein [Ceratobasidium sp. AG-Ba]